MDKILHNELEGLEEELKNKIREAAETIDAIKNNKVDALVVTTEEGEKILTLQEAENIGTNPDNFPGMLFDMTSEGILICDNNGKILRFNRAAVNLANQKFLDAEIDLIFNFINDKGEPISIKDLPESKDMPAYEIKFDRNDGNSFYLNLSKELLKDVNGDTHGFVVTLNDITKHMLAEIKALEMLKEKTLLLKEIHHRVKNSLQIMSSIINLQSLNITEPASQAIFTDLKARLKSIALIHEKLYQSESISEIKMDKYIIDLINYLKESYDSRNEQIEFIFDIDPIFIVPERAINIGIIINELITNSIKYAFPETNGSIWITMKQMGDESVLIIRDNGIGLPESTNIQDLNSLGLQLVTTLTEEVGGVLELNTEKGTEFKITFKITIDEK